MLWKNHDNRFPGRIYSNERRSIMELNDIMKPPQEHINMALFIEDNVTPEQLDLYLEVMNNKMMKDRVTNRELHDGCILVNSVWIKILQAE
jgi:hypothetical protein